MKPHAPRATGALVFTTATAAALIVAVAAGGAGAEPAAPSPQAPPDGVTYREAGRFTTAGKPRDLLLHPESKNLYVGSDDLADTADVNEGGLYVLNPADGSVRSTVIRIPGPTGTLGRRAVTRIGAALPGDGVVFGYPLRGIGTARTGDEAAAGVWVAGATVTDLGPGTGPGTGLVAQGPVLAEVDLATAAVRRSLTLEGGDSFAVDAARKTVWFTDFANRRLYKVDTERLAVVATVELPAGEGFGGFTEVDPQTGAVWVGLDNSVVVYAATGTRLGALTGKDLPRAARFDSATGQAFVVWQDAGDPSLPGSDNDGTLTVYRSADLTEAVRPVVLPGNQAQLGAASLAVQPGAEVVLVSSPAQGTITRLERFVPPAPSPDPSADPSADPSSQPSPSPDPSVSVPSPGSSAGTTPGPGSATSPAASPAPGPAAAGAVVGGTGGQPPAAGPAPAPAPHGSLASTGTTVLSLAGTAAALTLAGWALIRFRAGRSRSRSKSWVTNGG
ncbi:YncE family protein [Streptomyces goshikiensis]|uniref:YncE family protein n=1 Tax=Streptomyces goshikiensis TaxID=1942 RepID=UPI00364A52D2